MKYKMVVVEEAAQSQEPPVLCAVNRAHPHDGQLALVGDTQQLPPSCTCKWAELNGLGVSLMKRMREEARAPYTILSKQYRMHPSIRKWPSFFFYGDTLTDGLKALSQTPVEGINWPQPAGAIAFVNIHGAEDYHSDSKSYSNSAEAVALAFFLAAVLQVQQGPGAIRATDVGIITPYNAQVGLISWH
jgi:superfamily I DNA and/or RNA helicase